MGGLVPNGSLILVVEDDKDIRDSVTEILEDEGYVVTCATNGLEALTFLRSQTLPCVILLDLMMPIMDGWQFRQEQLRDEALAAIPVIVLSADAQARQQAAQMKVFRGLSKPIRVDTLLSTIGQVCEQQAS